MTESERFQLDFIFDTPNAFYQLAYDCKTTVTSKDDSELLDTKAVLIRATMLTSKSERVWMYGDNRPKWLINYLDNNHDEVAARLTDALNKRAERRIFAAS